MANEEQLSILKQGVEVWNRWREEKPNVGIDLYEADLFGCNLRHANFAESHSPDDKWLWSKPADLRGADLRGADLRDVDLRGANLIEANLSEANLRKAKLNGVEGFGAHLYRAKLNGADLGGAHLGEANLSGADLREAHLLAADLSGADLSGTDLSGADLSVADLGDADLRGSNFSKIRILNTEFRAVDLSEVKKLETVSHEGPSIIGIKTISISKGKIPEVFLRGCGLNDWEIEETKLYNPDLSNEEINKILYRMYDLRATQALQISPLFISYSHEDGTFIDKVEEQLNAKGIRFWRDIHDMKSGRLEKQIDRAIRQNPTVLLVLSEHSLGSDWVEHEVHTARGLEKEMGRDMLCPVALDDSWKSSRWPKRIMEQIMEYNILDFSAWEDDVKFVGMFRKLIDGLQLFYKDKSHGE